MSQLEQQQRQRVVEEALSWLKTPYHHHGRVKGAGVDCAQILCAVFEACGISLPIELGNYPRDWHLHRSEEMYEALLRQHGARQLLPGLQPLTGDIAVFQFGRTYSHGGILAFDNTIVHAYIGAGVILTRLDEAPLSGRPVHFWTIW